MGHRRRPTTGFQKALETSFRLVPPIRSYVDDITQYLQGTVAFICHHLPPAAAPFQNDMSDLECIVSAKSLAVASSVELQRLLQDEFKRHGVSIQFSTS
eukprot:5224669-Pyramimonas_sp.AAC.1